MTSSGGTCRKEEHIGTPELPNHLGASNHCNVLAFITLRELEDQLIVAQLAKEFQAFYGTQGSLLCSQETATGPYPGLDVSNQ
jgi:hypothetical protein